MSRSVRRRAITVLFWCLLAWPVATPTAASSGELSIDEVDVGSHPEVRLEVTVPGDVPTDDLDGAFRLTEGGETRAFTARHLESSDVEIVLLIDTSGSMQGEPIAAARRAADAFVGHVPAGTKLAIVGFGSHATVVSPLTTDRTATRSAIAGLVASGETALYDGVATALEQLPPTAAGDTVRRSIVLLSDGGDTASERPLDDVAKALAPSDVRLYAVELRTSETDPTALAALAEAGKGRVVPVDDTAALDAVYATLASELVNRVELVYRSESHGPLELRVEFAAGDVEAAGTREVVFPAAPAPPVVEPRPRAGELVTVPSLWEDRRVVIAAGTAVFLGMLGMTYLLLGFREPRLRLAGESGLRPGRSTGLAGVAGRATQLAERQLERRGRRASLNVALERAGLDLRPGEYLVLAASAATTALGVGVVLANMFLGMAFAFMTMIAARGLLSILASRRRASFADQLGDVLQLLAGSLRAGYGLMQAVDAVAREAEHPAADEFGRLVVEARLGRDVLVSLRAMAERVESEDFGWVVQAIEIHREVGGDLAEVLDTVAETIRERNQIRRQVKALSAEGRFSAYILLALPFGVAGLLSMTNPSYLAELTGSAAGLVMLFVAGTLMVLGALWMRKLTRLVF